MSTPHFLGGFLFLVFDCVVAFPFASSPPLKNKPVSFCTHYFPLSKETPRCIDSLRPPLCFSGFQLLIPRPRMLSFFGVGSFEVSFRLGLEQSLLSGLHSV